MAACGAEIHLGDIGTIFEIEFTDCDTTVDPVVTTPVDLTGATVLEFKFLKPSGTLVTKTAVVFGAATDGVARYTTVLDDLDELGNWKVQGYVELPTGKWHSDTDKFKVHANLLGA